MIDIANGAISMNVFFWLLIVVLSSGLFQVQSGPTASPEITAVESNTSVTNSDYTDAEAAPDQTGPSSELELRVLEDGFVTPEEYQEAVDAYLACMSASGYEMETTPAMYLPGMYQYQIKLRDNPSTPVPDGDIQNIRTVSDTCATGTTMIIEATYGSQISNPGNGDVLELMLQCLIDTDVISATVSYTVDDLERALRDEESDLELDFMNQQTISCMVNPSQNGLNGNDLIPATPPSSTDENGS